MRSRLFVNSRKQFYEFTDFLVGKAGLQPGFVIADCEFGALKDFAAGIGQIERLLAPIGGRFAPDKQRARLQPVDDCHRRGAIHPHQLRQIGLGHIGPIINQPQVAILALGAIRKVPAVIETPEGDFIGIRHKMFLSHSYDHRVVDGALGGQFVRRVADYLESFDINTPI